MRDYKNEFEIRVKWLSSKLIECNANGFVYGNSGGKDCTLAGILCKAATDNTLGIIMPCESKRNYGEDRTDALKAAKQYGIEVKTVDITAVKKAFIESLGSKKDFSDAALSNINPRLRMTALYAVAQSKNYLVVGTGNLSEITMGYFTKWGDGAYDLNPISDLTVTEVYEFLRYLKAPQSIIDKEPSAGLWEGQTDEGEMGVSYTEIDSYLLNGKASASAMEIIKKANSRTQHKRKLPIRYGE
ncbi:MAG: NAD(+) synthase [Clostridia bacterium]